MTEGNRYPIPAETCRVAAEIKRSRFVTTVGYTPTIQDARAFIDRVRSEFSDASHNCWAYQVGPPGTTLTVGMSDDGEPRGTAGKPILSVLTNSGIGDLTAVVTRYWGGIKLGRGGLVRAYSGGVQKALADLRLREHIVYETLSVVIDYASVTPFQRMLPDYEVEVTSEVYGSDVEILLKMPQEHVAPFRKALTELTNGQVLVEIVSSAAG